MQKDKRIVIYQTKTGKIELDTDLKSKTLWASQSQIADIFGVKSQAVTRHIGHIYKEKELLKRTTCSKMEQVRFEGKRQVKRNLEVYNLEVLIAVGYRIGSVTGTKFRQWANKVVKEYIEDGYAINRKIIEKNYQKFLEAVEETKKLLPENSEAIKSTDTLEIIKLFASTWFSLDAFDKGTLVLKKVNKKNVSLLSQDLSSAILELKSELVAKGEATHLFATDRNKGSLDGIVGNVMQSFAGKHVYESVEEKAAHLLYFIVKNHPFVDGNKRTGAFSFVWFLSKNKLLKKENLTPNSLTALTLLVAESKPEHKQNIIQLIMKLLES